MFRIEIKKSVFKILKKIPREDQIKITQSIHQLAVNPRHQHSIKLASSPYFRIRCGGYRIIYEILDDKLIVIILKVGHRREVYRSR